MRLVASQLSGVLRAPPSKSHTMRAILLASLGKGRSSVRGILSSPDTERMIALCRQFGAQIEGESIVGVAGCPSTPADVIDCGNSGQVLRFGGAMAALAEGFTVLTGDHSIRTRRPVQPLIEGIGQLGGFARSTRGSGYAPIVVGGRLKSGRAKLCGVDSQPVTALLLATALLEGESEIEVSEPGETPWIDLTLHWLHRLGHQVEHENYRLYRVAGRGVHSAFEYSVAGDWSSAAYPIVAAVLTGSRLRVRGLDPDDPQGDKGLVEVLQAMGARVQFTDDGVQVEPGGELRGIEVDVNPMIDMITLVALLGCFAEGETRIRGALIARQKECDRIATIAAELRKLGADLEEHEDGLTIRPARLRGAAVEAHRDHRIALTLAVAGMAIEGETEIAGWECTAKSYPGFAADLQAVGGRFEV